MTWIVRQDCQSQYPISHAQYLCNCFLHLSPLQWYCWYGPSAPHTHFPGLNFDAWVGAVSREWSSHPFLFILFSLFLFLIKNNSLWRRRQGFYRNFEGWHRLLLLAPHERIKTPKSQFTSENVPEETRESHLVSILVGPRFVCFTLFPVNMCRVNAKSRALEILYCAHAGALKGCGRWSEQVSVGEVHEPKGEVHKAQNSPKICSCTVICWHRWLLPWHHCF